VRSLARLLADVDTDGYPPIDGSQPCAQTDPDLWFPGPGQSAESQTAVALCGTCPFTDACRTYGLNHAVTGIWGGLSDWHRREMRPDIYALPEAS
jgi:hypothetical protein